MQKQALILTIILNLVSTIIWGENFEINYYHKGVSVYTQQVVQGEAIGTLPELNLVSCNDEINLFAGWIAEDDVAKYQTSNTATPTFITEEYVPTTNINLYAVFADKEQTNEMVWQQVKSNSELKDNDQIIITAHNFNYAIGKTIVNNHLTAIEITKSKDKSTITPNNDVQIFTLKKIDDLLWGLQTENGYLGNTKSEYTVTYYASIKDWSTWGFSFETTSVQITNQYNTHKNPFLFR